MKNLSFATLSVAFLAVGTVTAAPAEAAQLTKLDYSGTVNLDLTTGPETFSLVSPLLQPISDTFNTPGLTVIVDNLAGRLQDEGDSELTLEGPFSYLDNYLGGIGSSLGATFSLSGFGQVANAQGGFLSSFSFLYDQGNDVFTIGGYDFASIAPCITNNTCLISGIGSGAASISLLPDSIAFDLSFNITQTATVLPKLPVVPSFPIALASAEGIPVDYNLPVVPPQLPIVLPNKDLSFTFNVSLDVAPDPQPVPEPSVVIGLLGLSSFFATKRKRVKTP